jgi:hypothetical protein
VALCREGALVRAPGRHTGGVRVAAVSAAANAPLVSQRYLPRAGAHFRSVFVGTLNEPSRVLPQLFCEIVRHIAPLRSEVEFFTCPYIFPYSVGFITSSEPRPLRPSTPPPITPRHHRRLRILRRGSRFCPRLPPLSRSRHDQYHGRARLMILAGARQESSQHGEALFGYGAALATVPLHDMTPPRIFGFDASFDISFSTRSLPFL